jgi:hypothetical protein
MRNVALIFPTYDNPFTLRIVLNDVAAKTRNHASIDGFLIERQCTFNGVVDLLRGLESSADDEC